MRTAKPRTSLSWRLITSYAVHHKVTQGFVPQTTLFWRLIASYAVHHKVTQGFVPQTSLSWRLTASYACGNRILKAFANSLDPDETPQNVASHQDPNCPALSLLKEGNRDSRWGFQQYNS
ncbi:hypothetical protein DPMN_168392 [Dreissena polymorpha]|uniref:Uncharacterized protein n=1 Tax=Dreissena polymorpha TaxID=45954 RepID=A0A9D4F518_DREPO|nr:hypothetical protein DPMN_168392 [Dreissena polymorpha]